MQVTNIKLPITNKTIPLPRSKQLRLSVNEDAGPSGSFTTCYFFAKTVFITQRATLPGKSPKRLKKKKKKLVEEVSPQFISKTLRCVQDDISPLIAPLIMGRL